MSNYQYKVVPVRGDIKKGDYVDAATKQLQTTIDENVGQGWEFWQLGNLSIKIKPGCLQGLFGAKETFITYDQLIFRKESP